MRHKVANNTHKPTQLWKRPAATAARGIIRLYRLTFSSIFGRHCRYLPTCSDYADQAIDRFGLWPGGWMAMARFARCNPLGASGFDPVPDAPADSARWYLPWRYGQWTGRHIELRPDG